MSPRDEPVAPPPYNPGAAAHAVFVPLSVAGLARSGFDARFGANTSNAREIARAHGQSSKIRARRLRVPTKGTGQPAIHRRAGRVRGLARILGAKQCDYVK
jgi:hypothetical protein